MNFTDPEYEAVLEMFKAVGVHTEVHCPDWMPGFYDSSSDGVTYYCGFAEDKGVGDSQRLAEAIASVLLEHDFMSMANECHTNWRRCWEFDVEDLMSISMYQYFSEGPRGLMVIVDPTRLGYLLHVHTYRIE